MILITGASGFVGGALVKRLASECAGDVIGAFRRNTVATPEGVKAVVISNLLPTTDWGEALKGVRALVHCAARVHVMRDVSDSSLEAFRLVNVQSTLNLARQAANSGVRRFVFVSSIKVNGESTLPGRPFRADDPPAPLDPYGVSKLEAEQGLRQIEEQTGMEVVIVRPPLVYGPGVKANFAIMMSIVACGMPLPFGSIHNLRSMVALDNLVDLLVTCLKHPTAAGKTFLVSDGEDVSMTQLLKRMGKTINRPVRLMPVPVSFLTLLARLFGKKGLERRVLGFLQVDISKTCEVLSWKPPISLDEGLRRAFRQGV